MPRRRESGKGGCVLGAQALQSGFAVGLALCLPITVWTMGEAVLLRPQLHSPGVMLLASVVRMAFSFFVGVALSRMPGGRVSMPSYWVPILGLLLLLSLGVPMTVPTAYDAVAVVALFPALVWFAAKVRAGRWTTICRWSGALSYPLYCVHVPLQALGWGIWGHHGPLARFYDLLSEPGPIMLSLAVAAAVLVFWETPVRALWSRGTKPSAEVAGPIAGGLRPAEPVQEGGALDNTDVPVVRESLVR